MDQLNQHINSARLDFIAILLLVGIAIAPLSSAEPKPQPESEKRYYVIEDIPTPDGVVFEAGALCRLPGDRIAVATRRGDVYFADHVFGPVEDITYTKFASGLEEPLGLVWKDDWLYASEHTQVVRLKDEDGSGQADIYETFCNDWGTTPDTYHEFVWMAPPDRDGNFWVLLCLTNSEFSHSYLRGWGIRITPEGEMIPSVAGVRSPGGIGYDARGELFYCDNQGPWNGSNGLKHLRVGSHQGNPNGNKWYEQAKADLESKGLPDELGPDPGWPEAPLRIEDERKRNPRFVPPAVVFPINKVGRSPTGIVWDNSEGKFGPFAGQLFVGEITHSQLQRVFLEEVNGVQQGAVFPFLSGFRSGPVGVLMAEEGFLYTGETDRGWGSLGGSPFAFERVRWTGEVPFEILEMKSQPDGFLLTFTKPVDPDTAGDPASYGMTSWTYWLQPAYGSPEIDHTTQTITAASVAEDGLSVRLTVDGIVKGHVHELKLDGVRAVEDSEAGLWHPVAYYTVNEIPEAVAPAVTPNATGKTKPTFRVLVFSKTEGFRHGSIDAGVKALDQLCAEHSWDMAWTEDSEFFNDDHLAKFDVVVFLSTTGDVLNEDQQTAFENYIQAGGGFVGVHAATDTEYDWPWYNRLVGGYLHDHSEIVEATLDVIEPDHPSTAHLPERWDRRDEWYDFKDLNNDVNVLLNIDETTYEGGKMGEHHPIAWYHEFDGGRAWYTAGGHTSESYTEEDFMKHIEGGIRWAGSLDRTD